jgi:tRNA pseudouridine55 synthase
MDGILIVAKPPGPTSHDVVALVRRLAGTKRVGHGGTLDPFAGGVLPVFLGRATRIVEYHLSDRKVYRATVVFGATSTTDDLEGEQTPVAAPPPARDAVEAALAGFVGTQQQRPPAFSAVKVGGRRAYAMARAGAAVELTPREVTIHRLELVAWDDSDRERPFAEIEVECSAGTYIRAIARDLGAGLGSGAYLGALVRTASGPFRVEDAVPLDEIRTAATEDPPRLADLLRPIDTGLEGLPRVDLTAADVAAIAKGQFVKSGRAAGDLPPGAPLRLVDEAGRLVGIGRLQAGRIAPDKVLVEGHPAGRGRD